MPTYSYAHAKVKNRIFDVQFPSLVSFEMIFETLQSELGTRPSHLGTDSHTFEFNICFKIEQHISATLS